MSRRVRRFAVRAALLAPRLLPVAAAEVLAQPAVAWEAGGGLTRGPGAPGGSPAAWSDDGRLGSALRWGGPFGALTLDGAAALRGGGWQGAGRASALGVTPAWRGLRLSVGAEGRLAAFGAPALLPVGTLGTPGAPGAPAPTIPPDARARLTGDARLSWARGRGGVWLGMDATRARDVPPDSATPGAAIRPRAERVAAGAWRQLGGLVVGVTLGARAVQIPGSAVAIQTDRVFDGVRIRVDSTVFPFAMRADTSWRVVADTTPGSPSRLRRWSEIEARAGWARGRVALDAAAGVRPRFAGVAGQTWMEGTGSLALGGRSALVASGGTLPVPLNGPGVTRTFFTLGLRFAPRMLHRPLLPPVVRPVPTDFEVRGASVGHYVISVRLPGARAVELSGDFTGWKPVALRQVSADRWEVALPLTPGTHRCNVRVDGDRWVAPPGTTAVDDDFNGRVGLIVVP
ncbi:MAG: glycogen-binding domain-containing protein [Gemmatirosa sp.]